MLVKGREPMVKPIVRDVLFLARPAVRATANDVPVADDLKDTLHANQDRCVGLAANMIGHAVQILVFVDENEIMEMFNPEILKASGVYETEEGCLSLDGVRPVKRYRKLKVRWETREQKIKIRTFEGFSAQIIQHEMDHFRGILI